MNVETQLAIGSVRHTVVAKGHIANGQVIEVPPVGGLKARHSDVRLGIEFLRNPACDAVQLNTIQPAAGKGLRHQAKEVAHPHGRLQDIAAFKAKLLDGIVHALNHQGAGVVSVEGGSAGCCVLIWRQQFL